MVVAVLLASYKGEKYLAAQIESILAQEGVDVFLLVSDDVSAQGCINYLATKGFRENISVIDGPHKGVNANFAHLINSVKSTADDFFAFSDQDDVWERDKLRAAQNKLLKLKDKNAPLIYMGRTMVCDEVLNPLFLAKGITSAMSFQNALLESIAGGNTMVFNQSTLELLKKVHFPVHHDWLSYMVVTACGGEVLFDDQPYVLYRQHGANVIGANKGLAQKFYRFKKLLSNEFRGWAENNIKALQPLVNDMTSDNRKIYDGFIRLHEMRGWHRCFSRLSLFQELGLYRQRKLEHLGFMLAAFLGKI